MTQKEIKEYNKRCAEFLGLMPLNKPYEGAFVPHAGTKKIPESFLLLVHSEMEGESWYIYPKFHSDWNWIMEAVIAIQKIIIENNDEFCIEFYREEPIKSKTFVSVGKFDAESEDPKEAVIKAINKFLIRYNATTEV